MTAKEHHQTTKHRKSKNNRYLRKRLSCPICEYRLIDEGANTQSALHVMEENDSWYADYITKCQKCNTEIGLTKIE